MKKLLPVAVLAAMAGVNGAHAVSVNPDGLGQVLLYPYYTTEGGQDTYINVVNTTDQVKAVKVRFKESLNSEEVLDFNLYLSPKDHWSVVVTSGATEADAATITTSDTSCTVPRSLSSKAVGETGSTISFRNSEYDVSPEKERGLDRTKEGYVEIIEMGEVWDSGSTTTPNLATAATHSAGVPNDCGALVTAWSQGGVWNANGGDPEIYMTPPTGGLYGYGNLIDVQEGTMAVYDAVALDNFVDIFTPDILHAAPGDSNPNLDSGGFFAELYFGGEALNPEGEDAVDAVSMVLMHESIANDFVLEPTIDAGTDWVITFPTKNEYVNNGSSGDPATPNPATPPFTQYWDAANSRACESIGLRYWDREETPERPEDLDFSPSPPGTSFALCAEANVLTFNSSNVLEASDRGTGSDLAVVVDNGWMEMSFRGTGRTLGSVAGDVFHGLPSIGFAVQKYVNGTLENENGALLSNYAGSVLHKNTVSIDVVNGSNL
jgi:hypothetical protein